MSLDGTGIRRVIGFVSHVVSALSAEYERMNRAIAGELNVSHTRREGLRSLMSKLLQYCSSSLIKRTTDPLSSSSIATTAAAVTVATCQWSSYDAALPFLSNIGFSMQTSPQVTSTFLGHVLSSDVATTTLLSTEQSQIRVCSAWLRCVVCSPPPLSRDEELQQLTRLLPKLSLVQEILQKQNSSIEIADPLVMLQQLLRGISAHHMSASSPETRAVWKSRLSAILGDLCHIMEPVLNGSLQGENRKMCYRVGSVVVRHCARLIYSKMESRCLLPQLLDSLVLPISKRPPPQGMTIHIRTHLHHFLSGLFQLEPERDDFVNRKLKQIFSKYFHSYLHSPNPLVQTPPNPFLLLLQPCFGPNPPQHEVDVLVYSLRIICDQELTFHQHPSHLSPVVQFLHHVIEKISNISILTRCTLLLTGKLLSSLLCCELNRGQQIREKHSLRRHALGCLKLLIQPSQGQLPCSQFLPIVKDYLVLNLLDHKEAVFKPLVAISTYNVSLTRAMLPVAVRVVEEVEFKRGFGTDQLLRQSLAELEKTVTQTRA